MLSPFFRDLCKLNIFQRSLFLYNEIGGERGIRTLGGTFAPHSLSRRAPSASSAISPNVSISCIIKLAEGVGFEPTEL